MSLDLQGIFQTIRSFKIIFACLVDAWLKYEMLKLTGESIEATGDWTHKSDITALPVRLKILKIS